MNGHVLASVARKAIGSRMSEAAVTRPDYKKINPVIAPIALIAVTSDTLPLETLYTFADTVIRQKLSKVDGVANVTIQGAAKWAIKIRVDSEALASLRLGLLGSAYEYRSLIIATPNGVPVRLADVATVTEGAAERSRRRTLE